MTALRRHTPEGGSRRPGRNSTARRKADVEPFLPGLEAAPARPATVHELPTTPKPPEKPPTGEVLTGLVRPDDDEDGYSDPDPHGQGWRNKR